MNSLLFRSSLSALLCLFGFACLMAQQKEYKPKEEKVPGDPVAQPIAYSHKTHVALGLKCQSCHTIPGDGFQAAYPKEAFCMGCHTSVKKDSPEIQRLARFVAEKKPVPWNRIYQVPDIVWFSHAVHVREAKVDCGVCHGEVARREVLFKEKSTGMQACMECHAKYMAPNGCDFCHASQ
jgi:hypothetical protein